jgi:Antitoxin Phd_YefM, type II toxin-antitoxin system
MSAVTAPEFAKDFGRYKEEAQREPVAITSYGRVSGYFVSPREYEELQPLERRVRRITDLPPEIAEAIQMAKMNAAHDHLNALLDESQEQGLVEGCKDISKYPLPNLTAASRLPSLRSRIHHPTTQMSRSCCVRERDTSLKEQL